MNQTQKKQLAAKAALPYIPNGGTLGIGTGSTVNEFIDLLPSITPQIESIVSSSNASTKRLEELGFEVSSLNSVGDVDLYVDGADEATEHLHLIKGGGGALTREKIIAGAAKQFICIIDDTKQVDVLGAFPLPVEVIPMARSLVARTLVKMGGQPIWRENFITDNGNHILDVHNLEILNPIEMETKINQIAGIVTAGLFAHRAADILIISSDKGVTVTTTN